jgi:hypothetical protein
MRKGEIERLRSKRTEKLVAESRAQLDGWLYRFYGPHEKGSFFGAKVISLCALKLCGSISGRDSMVTWRNGGS